MYLGMALIYAGLAIGFDGPIAFALLPLVLIAIQTQVIAREERYLEAKFGDDYRCYKAAVRRCRLRGRETSMPRHGRGSS